MSTCTGDVSWGGAPGVYVSAEAIISEQLWWAMHHGAGLKSKKRSRCVGKSRERGKEKKKGWEKGELGRAEGRDHKGKRGRQGRMATERWGVVTYPGRLPDNQTVRLLWEHFVGGEFMKSTSGKEGMEGRGAGCHQKPLMTPSWTLGRRCLFSVVPSWHGARELTLKMHNLLRYEGSHSWKEVWAQGRLLLSQSHLQRHQPAELIFSLHSLKLDK